MGTSAAFLMAIERIFCWCIEQQKKVLQVNNKTQS